MRRGTCPELQPTQATLAIQNKDVILVNRQQRGPLHLPLLLDRPHEVLDNPAVTSGQTQFGRQRHNGTAGQWDRISDRTGFQRKLLTGFAGRVNDPDTCLFTTSHNGNCVARQYAGTQRVCGPRRNFHGTRGSLQKTSPF